MGENNYKAVVVGASAGGMDALRVLFSALSADYSLPIMVVQHQHPTTGNFLAQYLDGQSAVKVKEAEDKEQTFAGTVYLAPPNYHLLVEDYRMLALSADPPVNFSRPSIDVLFESAADIFRGELIGIILTGANSDGSLGLRAIKERGGLALVQDPDTAEVPVMPQSAMEATTVDHILPLAKIALLLSQLAERR